MSNEAPTDALRLVPVEPTEAMIQAGADALFECSPVYNDETRAHMKMMAHTSNIHRAKRCLSAMLAAAPASPLPGGGPHERWSILNHLGESWTPENFDTERQATAYLDSWKRDNPKMDLSRHRVIPVLVTMTAAPTGEPK